MASEPASLALKTLPEVWSNKSINWSSCKLCVQYTSQAFNHSQSSKRKMLSKDLKRLHPLFNVLWGTTCPMDIYRKKIFNQSMLIWHIKKALKISTNSKRYTLKYNIKYLQKGRLYNTWLTQETICSSMWRGSYFYKTHTTKHTKWQFFPNDEQRTMQENTVTANTSTNCLKLTTSNYYLWHIVSPQS